VGSGIRWCKPGKTPYPSFSGCGYRFFCLGKLPDGINEVAGHGPDDLSEEMKEHILTAKPSARSKLEKYGPSEVWNGFEIYEDGPKHLTITGRWLPEYPAEPQYRGEELLAAIAPYLKEAPPTTSPPPRASPTARKTSGAKFPQLNILDVIDTSGFSDSGSELVGTHPGIGSVTGANLKVNVGKNSWCNFHNELKRGGDPWVWLACECGAVPWEEAGSGVLTDPIVISTTMMHAAKRGLIPETPDIVAAFRRSKVEKKPEEPKGQTVIDAIKALAGVCDGAATKDGCGFNKFDREANEGLIDKVTFGEELSPKEEKRAYAFLKKYKKQLKSLGIDYDQIGHIARDDGEGCENALAGLIERIPAWIEEHHFKTVSDTKKIYHYDHGVYLDNGETVLETLIGVEFPELMNNKLVSDILGNVRRRTYTDRDLFNSRRVINVKNGLLDLETLQLQPHSPEYLSTAQLDVLYNPAAKAPKIAKFFQEVAESGDVALIEEIIGWLLWPDYHIHKAVMLVGPGRNGKGTLLRLITAFMGRKSISNVTLQDLVGDTFAKSDLYGKLANIGGDLPAKDLSDTSAFRNLTGGDDNRAQEKYRPAFSFRNKAKMLFSANVLPRSQDDTYAFYSRWILLEFLNRFVIDDGTADPNLDDKLQTPEELSGLLNIALEGLKRLKANGWKFSYTKTAEDVEVMYKRNANPVFAFLMDECEAGSATDYIEKSVFFDQFNAYVKEHNLRPMSTTKFGELLKDQTEIPVSTFRPWVDRGDRPMCWQGVKFRTPLTEREGNGEKPPKPAEKGEKPENKTTSVGLQSIPSILKPYSTVPEEKNEDKKVKVNERRVEYKQSIDGIDCDPLIAVLIGGKKIRFVVDYSTDLPGKPYEVVPAGTVVEVAPERAEHYIKKGVAEAVTA
jgi:P4 family phage/plasmid primase-like protien